MIMVTMRFPSRLSVNSLESELCDVLYLKWWQTRGASEKTPGFPEEVLMQLQDQAKR